MQERIIKDWQAATVGYRLRKRLTYGARSSWARSEMVGTPTNRAAARLARADAATHQSPATGRLCWRFAAAKAANFGLIVRDLAVPSPNPTHSAFAARSAFGWDATIADTLRTGAHALVALPRLPAYRRTIGRRPRHA